MLSSLLTSGSTTESVTQSYGLATENVPPSPPQEKNVPIILTVVGFMILILVVYFVSKRHINQLSTIQTWLTLNRFSCVNNR